MENLHATIVNAQILTTIANMLTYYNTIIIKQHKDKNEKHFYLIFTNIYIFIQNLQSVFFKLK